MPLCLLSRLVLEMESYYYAYTAHKKRVQSTPILFPATIRPHTAGILSKEMHAVLLHLRWYVCSARPVLSVAVCVCGYDLLFLRTPSGPCFVVLVHVSRFLCLDDDGTLNATRADSPSRLTRRVDPPTGCPRRRRHPRENRSQKLELARSTHYKSRNQKKYVGCHRSSIGYGRPLASRGVCLVSFHTSTCQAAQFDGLQKQSDLVLPAGIVHASDCRCRVPPASFLLS